MVNDVQVKHDPYGCSFEVNVRLRRLKVLCRCVGGGIGVLRVP